MPMPRGLRALLPGLLLPALTGNAGGWAVITVDDLPDAIETGTPMPISFTVRQHGVTLLDGLHPTVEARAGLRTVTSPVVPGTRRGTYTTSLDLPEPGDWSVTITSGFMNANVTLLPIPALPRGSRLTRPVADHERGARLFVAKGCVTCHQQIAVGPRLEGRRFDPAYIAGFLAAPPREPTQPGRSPMPNLGLHQREIASLVAYLNTDRQVGIR